MKMGVPYQYADRVFHHIFSRKKPNSKFRIFAYFPDLFQMKRQGRLIWQNYLGSGPAVMSTVLNLIRTRAGLPPAPANDEPSNDIFDEDSKPLIMDSLPIDMEPGESLGPLEPPMASR